MARNIAEGRGNGRCRLARWQVPHAGQSLSIPIGATDQGPISDGAGSRIMLRGLEFADGVVMWRM